MENKIDDKDDLLTNSHYIYQTNDNDDNAKTNNDNDNDNDWNLVESHDQNDNDENENECKIPFGNISQSIIIGTLNNRLNEISQKMDTIINKLDNLDNRIKNLEESDLNSSEYDPVIFNNPDIAKILKIDNEELEEIKSKYQCPVYKSSPIPVSRPTSFNPTVYDKRYQGLRYFSNNNINFKSHKPPFMIPFSSPY